MNETNPDEAKYLLLLNQFRSCLDNLNQYGLQLIKKYTENTSIKTGDIPIYMSLRHQMEIIDAIGVLISKGLADPCLTLLRSLFESFLQVEYILENDSEQRGRSFIYFEKLKEIEWFEKLDISTHKGKDFIAKINNDKILTRDGFQKPPGSDQILSDLRAQLKTSEFLKIHTEFEKQRKSQKIKHWYSMFNGPQTLDQLAWVLKLSGTYEILYRHLSESAHSTGIIKGKIVAKDGKGFMLGTRQADNIQFVFSITISLSCFMITRIIENKFPQARNEFKDFYTREIQDLFQKISHEELIKIERPL
jgi:hypothetical protein